MKKDVKKEPSRDGGFPPHVCSAVEAEHEEQQEQKADDKKTDAVAKGRKVHSK